MPSTTVIVPTYNRPKELRDCIRSVLNQTVKPDELLVVDDGKLESLPFSKEAAELEVPYRLIRKETPGITASRIAGVAASNGDVVFFLDDDVVLFPDYIEEMLRVYGQDEAREIGGVGAMIANVKRLTPLRMLRYAYDLAFMINGFREGSVLPSGSGTDYGTTPWPLCGTVPVQFLPGGASSYRREVLDRFTWSLQFGRRAKGEDRHFSFRVSRRYKLVMATRARLYHYETPTARQGRWALGRRRMVGHFLFFRDCVQQHWYDWIPFAYTAAGYLLARTAVAITSRDESEWDRVRGIWDALRAIMSGADPVEPGPAERAEYRA